MILNWKVALPFLIMLGLVISTPFFGQVESNEFSAYAACRKEAMLTKGYGVWQHTQTTPKMFRSRIIFFDGFRSLDCGAIGIGPFWMVRRFLPNWANCEKDSGDGNKAACTEDYYGVNP